MKNVSRAFGAVLFFVSLAAMSTACKAKVGDDCKANTGSCQDEKTSLSCQAGKLIAVPCKGAKGCAINGEALTCDASGNANGDVCSTDDEGNADCSADLKGAVICKGGKWTTNPCPGGCHDDGKTVTCKDAPLRKSAFFVDTGAISRCGNAQLLT